ncbi:zinc finger protein 345-like [Ptychodera flava]|uniref:zinc finger protein 345-like n=1 Tax=Ptychodera flava TaxID=63121 RepID=UPI003969EDCE
MEVDASQMSSSGMLSNDEHCEMAMDCQTQKTDETDLNAAVTESENMNLVAEIINLNQEGTISPYAIQKSILEESIVDSQDLAEEIVANPQDVEMFHLGVCESEVIIDHTEVVDTEENSDLEIAITSANPDSVISPSESVQSGEMVTDYTGSSQKPSCVLNINADYVKVVVVPENTYSCYLGNTTDQPLNVAVNSNFTFGMDSQNKDETLKTLQANQSSKRRSSKRKRQRRKGSKRKRKKVGKGNVSEHTERSDVVDKEANTTEQEDSIPVNSHSEDVQCNSEEINHDETPMLTIAECQANSAIKKRASNSKHKTQKCKNCGRSYVKPYIAAHRKKCVKNKFQCPTCHKQLLTGKMLRRHLVSCGKEKPPQSEEKGIFQCRVCDFITTESDCFNAHQKTHFVERCEKISKKIYKCNNCSYTCTVEKALIAHTKSDSCGSTKVMVSCKICGNDYKDTDSLAAHMLLHKVENGYMCDICGAEFFTTQKVIQHRRTHTNERPFKCKFCSYCCNRADNLRTHIKRKHKSVAELSDQQSKTEIISSHKKKSKKRGNLKQAEGSSQKQLRKKASCQFDENTQRSRNGVYCVDRNKKPVKLSRHLSCKICQIEFPTLVKKNQHMESHKSGDKYQCELCNFKVLSISKLVEHIRMHTGEKPNKCKYCSYRCAKRDNLLTHMKHCN